MWKYLKIHTLVGYNKIKLVPILVILYNLNKNMSSYERGYEMEKEKIDELYIITSELPKGVIVKIESTIYKGEG